MKLSDFITDLNKILKTAGDGNIKFIHKGFELRAIELTAEKTCEFGMKRGDLGTVESETDIALELDGP